MFSARFPIDWRVCPDCMGLGVLTGFNRQCDSCGGTGAFLYDDIRKYVLINPKNRGFYRTLNDSIHSLPEIDE